MTRLGPARGPDDLAAAQRAVASTLGDFRPDAFLVLGSGLGEVVRQGERLAKVDFHRIDGLSTSHTEGHAGRLWAVRWTGQNVLVAQGRLHFYEGHDWDQVTFLVRLAARMGARRCVFTNMAGGIRRSFRPGELVLIDDHLNLIGSKPAWTGALGCLPRDTYPAWLKDLATQAAAEIGLALPRGIYAAVRGPNYETPAEVRALELLGIDLVGMSTVGEVQVARCLGMECLALSCVANHAAGIARAPIRHEDVLMAARGAQAKLGQWLTRFFERLPHPEPRIP